MSHVLQTAPPVFIYTTRNMVFNTLWYTQHGPQYTLIHTTWPLIQLNTHNMVLNALINTTWSFIRTTRSLMHTTWSSIHFNKHMLFNTHMLFDTH